MSRSRWAVRGRPGSFCPCGNDRLLQIDHENALCVYVSAFEGDAAVGTYAEAIAECRGRDLMKARVMPLDQVERIGQGRIALFEADPFRHLVKVHLNGFRLAESFVGTGIENEIFFVAEGDADLPASGRYG